MSISSTQPTRRLSRADRGHLTLVPSPPGPVNVVDAVDDGPDELSEAEQHRKLSIAGSATVRALIALGALASAIGIPLGRQAEAAYTHRVNPDTPLEQADPAIDAVIETAPARTASRPVNAGHWAPAVRVEPAAYTMREPEHRGTGKHRKPTPALHTASSHNPGTGRHRRATTPVVTTPQHTYHSTDVTLSAPTFGTPSRTGVTVKLDVTVPVMNLTAVPTVADLTPGPE